MNKHIFMSIFALCAISGLDAHKGCSSCPAPKPNPAKPTEKKPVRTVAAPQAAPAPAPAQKAPTFKPGKVHKFEELRPRNRPDDQATLDKIKSHPHVILVYSDETFCAPCKSLAPILDEIAREWDGLIVKIRPRLDSVAAKGVKSMPTMHFYNNGSHVKTEVGFKAKASMRNSMNIAFGK